MQFLFRHSPTGALTESSQLPPIVWGNANPALSESEFSEAWLPQDRARPVFSGPVGELGGAEQADSAPRLER
ncbi:MAG: hypothetical protein R2698_07710 [Microthrixaceae bacterium]